MLDCQNVSFAYGERSVLTDVTFSIKRGDVVAVLGPSGCGKTTLFRLLSGLERPRKGFILLEGRPLPRMLENVAYMMQDDMLLPWRRIVDNVTLCLEIAPGRADLRRARFKAEALLEAVGLAGQGRRYPAELSGGMRQRAALARTILQDRPLILLDEPFGALDIMTRESLYRLLLKLSEEHGKTILLVTHDFNDALALADRILLMSRGGRIYDQVEIPSETRCDPLLYAEMQFFLKSALAIAIQSLATTLEMPVKRPARSSGSI